MKFVFILLVLSIYITTIRPFLLEDAWRRLFQTDHNNSSPRLAGPFNKNIQIENKPYARSLKSVDNELNYDLENKTSAERTKHDAYANRRMNYIKRVPHRRDNVEVWNNLLESLKMDTKLISRQKKENKFGKLSQPQKLVNQRIRLQKPVVLTKQPLLKPKKSLRRVDDDKVGSSMSVSSEWDYGMDDWRQLIQQERKHKMEEAHKHTEPLGDMVNMAAARPWSISCGDPKQHDMPWGTCMLPMECEPELRIYRGDVVCGKTQFVCCALQLNNYDMYVGADISFADTDLQGGSDYEPKSSKELKKIKEKEDNKQRERERKLRKKRMKKNIQRVVKRIKMILTKMYKNTTVIRKLKTKNLKAYIKMLKRKYKQDRKDVKELHDHELTETDNALFKKLDEILHLNKEFAHNETFREILVNGTISPKAARMLSVMYPDLAPSLRSYSRRTGANLKDGDSSYDVEYGFLYY